MASPTFVVSVQHVQDKTLTLRIRATTAGGLDDKAISRSFILSCFRENEWTKGTSLTSLIRKLDSDNLLSRQWLQENLDTYIEETEIEGIYNADFKTGEVYEWYDIVEEDFKLKPLSSKYEEKLIEKHPYYVLKVVFADAAYIKDITIGAIGESYSWDIWYNDPKSKKA